MSIDRPVLSRVMWGLFCLVTVFLVASQVLASSYSWLDGGVPSVQKLAELTPNTPPPSRGADCDEAAFQPPGYTLPITACLFDSPFGSLTTDGKIVTGSEKAPLRPVRGPSPGTYFLDINRSDEMVLTTYDTYSTLQIYKPGSLRTSSLVYAPSSNVEPYYYVRTAASMVVKDTAGYALYVNTTSMGASTNGKWLVAVSNLGLVRMNTDTWEVKLFGARPGSGTASAYIGPGNGVYAISDDGNLAAISSVNADATGPALHVYDLTTCTDQQNVPIANRSYCKAKDVWNGYIGKTKVDGGIKSTVPEVARPLNVRFRTNETISFNAIYDYQAAGPQYKAATYTVTVAGAPLHGLGLLGMGDSFIAGQGEFDYRAGTDTANNGCHLSDLSYPMLLGRKYMNSYNTIACSGAKIGDVLTRDLDAYRGQAEPKVAASSRDNRVDLLNTFIPGYLNQQEFIRAYKPNAVLLSIGGNDIHFADILKGCVTPLKTESTCYSTYEDRVELIKNINSQYARLVSTYKSIRENANGARVYVVGYPQIVKPDGDCGANVHLDSAEVLFASQLISYLDGVVAAAASTAGVMYVDTQHALDGFRLCEAPKGQAAMNGVTAGKDSGFWIIKFIGNESYHPTKLGHALLAKTIDDATGHLTKPMPAPTPFGLLVFNDSIDLLQNVPHTQRQINTIKNDETVFPDIVLKRGGTYNMNVQGSNLQLQPKSIYSVTIHSTPRTLVKDMKTDEDGNITTTYTVPADVEPGLHVLHLYAKNMAGETLDIPRLVYVAASETDFDGDGVPNSANQCLIFSLSGQDYDKDGVDDVCDPEIVEPPVVVTPDPAPNPAPDPVVNPVPNPNPAPVLEPTSNPAQNQTTEPNPTPPLTPYNPLTPSLPIHPDPTPAVEATPGNANNVADRGEVLSAQQGNDAERASSSSIAYTNSTQGVTVIRVVASEETVGTEVTSEAVQVLGETTRESYEPEVETPKSGAQVTRSLPVHAAATPMTSKTTTPHRIAWLAGLVGVVAIGYGVWRFVRAKLWAAAETPLTK